MQLEIKQNPNYKYGASNESWNYLISVDGNSINRDGLKEIEIHMRAD